MSFQSILQDGRAWSTPFITYSMDGAYWQNMSATNITLFQTGYGAVSEIKGTASLTYSSDAIDTWLSYTATVAFHVTGTEAQIGIMEAKLKTGLPQF